MITVNAHFDGRVIVPDEPLEFPANQPLIVRIEAAPAAQNVPEYSALAWLAENALEADTPPADLAAQHDHYLYGCPKED